jgi:prophage regulatory protein
MSEQISKWSLPHTPGRAIIKRAELRRRVPFTLVHIWRLEQTDDFPQRIQLGTNAVGWFEDEVDAWVASRIRGGGRFPSRREVAEAPGDPAPIRPRLVRRAPIPGAAE